LAPTAENLGEADNNDLKTTMTSAHGDAILESMLDLDALRPERVRPLKRVEFERMAELGMFDDERVELLRGQVVVMTPVDSAHNTSVARLAKALTLGLGYRAEVRGQSSFVAEEESEPLPDVSVLPPGNYWDHNPAQAFLLIEVADTSLRKDRDIKSRLYAEAGVPEYWIVDLVGRAIEVYRQPDQGEYRSVVRHGDGERVALLAFSDVTVAVNDVLPPRG
jgi:Uma2 family endonuclease